MIFFEGICYAELPKDTTALYRIAQVTQGGYIAYELSLKSPNSKILINVPDGIRSIEQEGRSIYYGHDNLIFIKTQENSNNGRLRFLSISEVPDFEQYYEFYDLLSYDQAKKYKTPARRHRLFKIYAEGVISISVFVRNKDAKKYLHTLLSGMDLSGSEKELDLILNEALLEKDWGIVYLHQKR